MKICVLVDEFPETCEKCMFSCEDADTDREMCFLTKTVFQEGDIKCPLVSVNTVIDYE